MSFLRGSVPDSQQLERYLLGLLSEEDAERLDQASIQDDEVAARLRIAEDDLIDGYVRSTLPRDTAERFEAHYLSSARRRERVAFAARFLRAIDRAAEYADPATGRAEALVTRSDGGEDAAAGHTGSGQPARVDEPGGTTPSPQTEVLEPSALHRTVVSRLVAAAAAVLLVVCGALVLNSRRGFDDVRVGRPEIGARDGHARQVEPPRIKPEAIDPGPVKDPEPIQDLATMPRGQPAARVPSGRVPEARETLTTALVLWPQTRASGSIPVLTLPRSDRVGLELRLEPNDASHYEVRLRDPATNQIVWRSGPIAKRSAGDDASLIVQLPVSLLNTQHYSLDLVVRGDGLEPAGSYTFRVSPR
jgi:hypothetical protein